MAPRLVSFGCGVCLFWLLFALSCRSIAAEEDGGSVLLEGQTQGEVPSISVSKVEEKEGGVPAPPLHSESCAEALAELRSCRVQLDGAEQVLQTSASELSHLQRVHEEEMGKCGASHAEHQERMSECERDKALLSSHLEEAHRQQKELLATLDLERVKSAEEQQRHLTVFEERLSEALSERRLLQETIDELRNRLAALQSQSLAVRGDTIKKLAAVGADLVALYTATAEWVVDSVPSTVREAVINQAMNGKQAVSNYWMSATAYIEPYYAEAKRVYDVFLNEHLQTAAVAAKSALLWTKETVIASFQTVEPTLNAAIDAALEEVYVRRPLLKEIIPLSLLDRILLSIVMTLGAVLCGVVCKKGLSLFCLLCRAMRRGRISRPRKKKFIADACSAKDEKGCFGLPSPKRMPVRPAELEKNKAIAASHVAHADLDRGIERDGERRRLNRLG